MSSSDDVHSPLLSIGLFALFSILWMLTLVPLARAIFNRKPLRNVAAAHAFAWMGLLTSGCWLGSLSRTPMHDVTFVSAFLGGILVIESAIMWFGVALQKQQGRRSSGNRMASTVQTSDRQSDDEDSPGDSGSQIGLLPVSLVIVALAVLVQRSATLSEWSAAIHRHAQTALHVLIPLAVLGFAGFMLGIVRLALTRGEPMTKQEIEQQISSAKLVGRPFFKGAFKTRIYGEAIGNRATERVGISEMKAAWHSGQWRRNPRWRAIFFTSAGALMMIFSGFGIAFAAGPPMVQILTGFALVYGVVRLSIGWARA